MIVGRLPALSTGIDVPFGALPPMRLSALLAATALLAVLLPTCAVVPVQSRVQVENPQTLTAPHAKVWAQVILMLTDKGLPITSAEKDSGLISTGTIDIKGVSKIAEPLSIWESSNDSMFDEGRYRVTVIINEVDASNTSVKMSPYIEAFSGGQYIHKESTGVLESTFFKRLRSNLGLAAPASSEPAQ